MADEQELLSIEARQDIAHLVNRFMGDHIRKAMDTGITPPDGTGFIDEIDKLLKAMGYEQVRTKCPDCDGRGWNTVTETRGNTSGMRNEPCSTCKGTGRKRKLVEWDRELAALSVKCNRVDSCVVDTACSVCEKGLARADQLYKELTGGGK